MLPKVYVTRLIPKAGLDLLRPHCELIINEKEHPVIRNELENIIGEVDALLCLLNDTIDADLIKMMKKVKIISNYAVGYNNIDIKAAKAKGIMVTNTPGVLTDATADLAWALIFAIARQIVPADKFVREAHFEGWTPMLFIGGDITNSTLGIIGAGRIGTAVAKRAKAFNMNILYHNRGVNSELEDINSKKVSLRELLEKSDFVSLHLPLTEETHHLIDADMLKLMKPTAYLINTSRGAIVDEKALVEALKNKQIAGAGLDVYEEEPKVHKDLMFMENVVLLPHIGSATLRTRTKMSIMVAEDILAVLQGKRPINLVN